MMLDRWINIYYDENEEGLKDYWADDELFLSKESAYKDKDQCINAGIRKYQCTIKISITTTGEAANEV